MRYFLFFTGLLLSLTTTLPGQSQGLGGLLNKAKQKLNEQTGTTNDRSSNPGPPSGPSNAKMVFSNVPFTESGTGVKTVTKFAAADHIYCRVELKQPIQEVLRVSRSKRGIYIQVQLDFQYKQEDYRDPEGHGGIYNYMLTPEQLTQNYLNFDLYPTEVGEKSPFRSFTFEDENIRPVAAVFCAQWLGEATVNFELQNPNGTALQLTGFTLTSAPAGTTAVACEAAARIAKKDFKDRKLPPVFSGPAGSFQDPQLSMAVLRKQLSSPGAEIYRILVEPGPDYEVFKDDYGRFLFKKSKVIWATYKDVKTGKCYFSGHSLRRQYEGGGKYGQLSYGSVRDVSTEIECALIKSGK